MLDTTHSTFLKMPDLGEKVYTCLSEAGKPATVHMIAARLGEETGHDVSARAIESVLCNLANECPPRAERRFILEETSARIGYVAVTMPNTALAT